MPILTIEIGGASFLAAEDQGGLLSTDVDVIQKHWNPEPGDLCLDIGFGPGTWTLVALAKGAHTISFDPKPDACRILLDLMLLNMFTRGWIVPAGVWSRTGVLPFGANGFREEKMEDLKPVVQLDEFFYRDPPRRIDYINMDAEWAEAEVVRGARGVLRRYHPKLVIEIHDDVFVGEITEELSKLGGTAKYDVNREAGFLICTPR